MPDNKKMLTAEEYGKMADELDAMAAVIRARPRMNHHFAERLALLAKQMREDANSNYPSQQNKR